MHVVRRHFLIMILLLVLSVSVFAQDTTPSPTPEPEPQVLKIWWPDVLIEPENSDFQELLDAQVQGFADSRENIIVELRLRRVGTKGGIMSTLRSGSLVAEDALPTLTLVRRQDLVSAVRAGLLQSMEGMIPSSIQGELDTALTLGQVNEELYGLPYILELQHLVTRQHADQIVDGWTFEALLEREDVFAMPTENDGRLSDVVLLQYLDAGGTFNRDGFLTLDEAALRIILDFYSEAQSQERIIQETVDFASHADYMRSFTQADFDTGVFTSTQFLELQSEEEQLQIAPIPTNSGQSASILNGWMWVLVTNDPEEQRLAEEFLTWIMDIEGQAEVASSLHMIPSQRSAIPLSLANQEANIEAYLSLLDNTTLPVTESEGGTLAGTLHEALSSVLLGERSVDEAIQFVLDQQPE